MNFHKNFQLNGKIFSSTEELLQEAALISDDIHLFLKEWFSNLDAISVKTSGSTGTPKTIQLKKALMVNSALATGSFFDLKEHTTALLCLSANFIAGKMMLVRAMVLGWHLDVVESNATPLERSNKKYDFSAMVPLQLVHSLDKIDQIKQVIIGGGVVSSQLQEKVQNLKSSIFATYGMTETSTHIAVKKLNNFKDSSFLDRHFYQILPNVKMYKDERNCLVIAAPKVAEEIMVTNDVVALVSEKHFEWLGRFDHVINSGGIKLHPEKIEEKLAKIIENRFFVTGIFDEKFGQKLVLLIEQKVSSTAIEKSLRKTIKNLASLSKFEIPKEIYFVAAFLETETGKIQRDKTAAFLSLEFKG
jgi:O-succinylbenzoic acid--CoA ligase